MKIRTALYGASAVPLGLAAIVVLILLISMHQVEQARTKADLINSLLQGITDLNMLTCECLQHFRQDSRIPWQQKQAEVADRLGRIAAQDDEDRRRLDSIAQDHQAMGSLFARVMDASAAGATASKAAADGQTSEFQAQLLGQILQVSHRMIATGQELGERSHAEVASTQTTACRRAIVTMLLVSLAFFITLILLTRRIHGPLAALNRAVETAGRGNLDVRLPTGYADEVGDVCRAFNEMVRNLQESRRDLEREIAARQRAEEALRASETRLRQIIDLVPHFIFAKDRQGRYLMANRTMAEVYGTTPEQIIGTTDADHYVAGSEIDRFVHNDVEVIDGDRPKFIPEEVLVDSQGNRRILQVVKIPFSAPGLPEKAVLGVAVEITRLKQIEEQLRKAHDDLEVRIRERTAEMEQERYLLHTLMDNLPHNIYFKDVDSRFIRINKAMATFFGLKDASEAIGKNDCDFFTDEHSRQAMADEQEILSTGRPVIDKEEKETWPDGHSNWALTTKMPLRDETGRIVGTFGISRDITERKQVGEALRVAKEAAEAASRAKSVFLANMSHEIRTPLNAIIGMSELLLDTSLSQRQRDFLLAVRDSGEVLLSVINDILDFSKIEAGKLALDRETFDLRDNLGDTMKSFAFRAHKQGLELACRIDSDVPHFVVGDYNRLRQIIVNLVGNAVKFTDRGEVILTVEAQCRTEHDVTLHFAVCDTGIGIPTDKQTAIFEMFEQADSTLTRRHGGTGLGLAIVSRLVELMDGHIWVESEPGCGSRFHFTVRLGVAEEDSAETEPGEPLPVRGLPVLVVDDNATNRRILEEVLRNWRMEPTSAGGAAEAIELMRQAQREGDPFRLVLTDAHMPEIDGFTFARQIKQDEAMGSTVVMMLTSGGHDDDVSRCEELGIAAYLLKPIKQSELLDAIKLAIGVTAPEEEASAALAQRPRRLGPLRILLVEDSLVNQKLAVAMLETHDHKVTVANHGREGLAIMESRDFDLVLMDVQMPEMDGLETTAAIRAKERQTGGHVPILAMTAHALKGDRERCLAAGMDEYIAKPIHAKELFDLIESMFTGRQADQSSGEPRDSGPAEEATTSAAPPDSGTPPLDVADEEGLIHWAEVLAGMRGDPRLLRVVVETALEEIPRLMATIRRDVAEGDATRIRLDAHTLKGSLRYFGDIPAYEEVFRLEQMAKTKDLSAAGDCLAALEIAVEATLQAIRQFRQRNP